MNRHGRAFYVLTPNALVSLPFKLENVELP